MKVHYLTPFTIGYFVTSRRPPRPEMTVVVRGTFVLRPGHPVVPPEGIPTLVQGALSAEVFREGDFDRTGECLYPSDLADFKLRADVLLRGTCHVPGGVPVPECPVKFTVGGWSKALRVLGTRAWSDGMSGAAMSKPLPFTRMPVDWAHAFGGPGFAKNPVGKGYATNELPNVEHAGDVIRSRSDRPDPAGFGPLNRLWPQRAGKVGVAYGDAYQKKRAPYYAEDFDWSYFNAAPEDQQIEGYLRGDEEISFHNLHPAAVTFDARLPGLRIRAFVKDVEGRFREVRMNLDTLLADLDSEVLRLTWRGVDPVERDDLTDVAHLLVASEPLADAPRDLAHHRSILEELEKDPLLVRKHLPAELHGMMEEALYERPREAATPEPAADPVSALLRQKLGSFAAEEQERVRQAMAQASAKAPPDLGLLLELSGVLRQLGEEARKGGPPPPGLMARLGELKARMDRPAAMAAGSPPARGLNDALADVMKERPAEPPGGAARSKVEIRERIRDARSRLDQAKKDAAARGQTIEHLEPIEAALQNPMLDRMGLGEAEPIEPGPGRDLSGRDLRDEDLSGRDLTGANLEGALLTGANLRGAKLAQANLTRALFCKADLSGADLSESDLTSANLAEANAAGAVLTGATLRQTLFLKTDLTGAILTGAKGESAVFQHANLRGARAGRATLRKTFFMDADLEEADFEGARLEQCMFKNCRMARAVFRRAVIPGTSFHESDLTRATFEDAAGEASVWLGATLAHVDFSYAVLPGAFFCWARAQEARFFRADLARSRFDKAALLGCNFVESNLFRANLGKAVLTGVKLTGAHLFEAALLDTVVRGCDFENANLARARLRLKEEAP